MIIAFSYTSYTLICSCSRRRLRLYSPFRQRVLQSAWLLLRQRTPRFCCCFHQTIFGWKHSEYYKGSREILRIPRKELSQNKLRVLYWRKWDFENEWKRSSKAYTTANISFLRLKKSQFFKRVPFKLTQQMEAQTMLCWKLFSLEYNIFKINIRKCYLLFIKTIHIAQLQIHKTKKE